MSDIATSRRTNLHRFANPGRFQRTAGAVQPWLSAFTVLAFALGLPLALVFSPPDYQQGESVRIMYVHVPAAWVALFGYLFLAGSAFSLLVWRHPLAAVLGRAAAPVGAGFTFLALATGSLWGKPMWGTWWVWDARLTSVLVLLFLYLGYVALLHAFDDEQRGERAAAVLALVGVVNLPIIKFSVDWWNTLHQPASVLRLDGPTIDPSMLHPLLVMAIAYTALFFLVVLMRARAELLAARTRSRAGR